MPATERTLSSLGGLSEDEVLIKIVGLRPGEKLYEELFREDEGAVPSAVERVFVAPLALVDPDMRV